MSPTARSLAKLRKEGWLAEVIERFIPGINIRKDYAGWADILALHPERGEVLLVQTTTKHNLKSRINKITNSDTIGIVRKCGVLVHCHGWFKKGNRWQCEVKDVS